MKTAGVDESIHRFSGPARVCESQEEAVNRILSKDIKAGDVVIIRYEGPRGGPGMQEMLYPTSYLKSMRLGAVCALITDGRFSGGTSGLSIGHVSPEAGEGGAIGLIQEGDVIEIDIPARTINVALSVGNWTLGGLLWMLWVRRGGNLPSHANAAYQGRCGCMLPMLAMRRKGRCV